MYQNTDNECGEDQTEKRQDENYFRIISKPAKVNVNGTLKKEYREENVLVRRVVNRYETANEKRKESKEREKKSAPRTKMEDQSERKEDESRGR